MSIACPACQGQLPNDARFCGFCGFRLTPIQLASRTPARDLLSSAPASTFEPLEALPTTDDDPLAPDLPFAETMPAIEAIKELSEHRDDKTRNERPSGAARRHRRFPLKVELGYSSAHNFFTGRTVNISTGGLFVATDTPAAKGEVLEVEFTLPGVGYACQVTCEVRWVRGQNEAVLGHVAGMGLGFVNLTPPVKSAIAAFINHREPIIIG